MTTLVIAETQGRNLHPATLSTLSAAKLLDQTITLILIGEYPLAEQVARLDGVSQVLWANSDDIVDIFPGTVAKIVFTLSKGFSHFLMGATHWGRQVMPVLATLLDSEQISDITAIIDNQTFVHPLYAGNILETVAHLGPKKTLTVRPTAFKAVPLKQATSPILALEVQPEPSLIQSLGHSAQDKVRPPLNQAKIILAGGRGLKTVDNFTWLESFADKLGAAVGASRAAVDAGLAPNEYQIGQTGQVVAPDLYIAVGISGAVQHVAGMKDSRIIIAINKDPEAPIFRVADYGLVGDLFSVLPELVEHLDLA